ncbi:MAG: hypothetical protein LBD20_04005 [Spirochaetaceae bacterium]|nr:hypothetical protein [Spirochaetaceae bacterium]
MGAFFAAPARRPILEQKTALSAPTPGAMDGAWTEQVRFADLGAFLQKAEMPSSKIGTEADF